MSDTRETESTRPSDTVTDQVIDIQSARERLGSEALLKKVAGIFRANAPRHMSEIKEATATGDSVRLERSAHTIVSSMAYLSAKSAISAALALEHMGHDGDLSSAQEAYERLEAEIARLDAAISVLLE